MDYDLLLPYSGETLKIYGHRQHGNIVLAVLGQALHTAASTLQLLCDLQVINHCCDLPAVERQDTMQCVDVCCPPCLPGSMACCAVLCRAGSHCLTGCVASSIDADSPIVTQCRIPSSIKHVHSPGACIRWARNRRPVFHTSVEPPSSCCCDTSRADATARAAMSAELLAEHCFFGLFYVSFA